MTHRSLYEPHGVFALCVAYLESKLWLRDGDDAGIFIDPVSLESYPFGEALELQLEWDGVSVQEVPAE